ncbi:hypothetical protein L873DRAFT_1774919 [Choiromyces venosus 120613-1]|uniref:MARVEL domain-containing protein n=1 Tax=Choiromyces venosus 120613-1 TaxID=1336337 RepID=A0A3N4JFA4_9PEZI|nr:hypothetical protein L873DRAFT_1774919 [Choiromyces venosus 120613-1]
MKSLSEKFSLQPPPPATTRPPSYPSSISSTTSLQKSLPLPPLTHITTSLSRPAPPSTSATPSLYISRSRFLLRLITALFSFAIVITISTTYTTINRTFPQHMLYNGRDLWPAVINLHPTTILLATSSVTAILSTIVLIAGVKPQIRHVGGLGDWMNFGVSGVSLVLAAVGAGCLIGGEGEGDTVWGWTCKNPGVDHPDVQFSLVCVELNFAFTLGWGIVAVEALIIVNVVVGWFVVRRGSLKRRRGTASQVVV